MFTYDHFDNNENILLSNANIYHCDFLHISYNPLFFDFNPYLIFSYNLPALFKVSAGNIYIFESQLLVFLTLYKLKEYNEFFYCCAL